MRFRTGDSSEIELNAAWWHKSEKVWIRALAGGDLDDPVVDAWMNLGFGGGSGSGSGSGGNQEKDQDEDEGEDGGLKLRSSKQKKVVFDLLCFSITRWTFLDESGKTAPINQEMLEKLYLRDLSYIVSKINEINGFGAESSFRESTDSFSQRAERSASST